MTELRPTASTEAVSPDLSPRPALRPMLTKGFIGLILGAAMTILAVLWSNGVLGFLSLMTVFGSLTWISLVIVRHYSARLRRP